MRLRRRIRLRLRLRLRFKVRVRLSLRFRGSGSVQVARLIGPRLLAGLAAHKAGFRGSGKQGRASD